MALTPTRIGARRVDRAASRAVRDARFVIEDEPPLLFPPCRIARLSAEHILSSGPVAVARPDGPTPTVSQPHPWEVRLTWMAEARINPGADAVSLHLPYRWRRA